MFKISNLNIKEQLIFLLMERAQKIDVGKGDKAPVSLCHLTRSSFERGGGVLVNIESHLK